MKKERNLNWIFRITEFTGSCAIFVLNCFVFIKQFELAYLLRWIMEILEMVLFLVVFAVLVYMTRSENLP